MRDFVYSHRTLIRRALQVKLPMLQVSVNPCCFTIFTTKENCIFFYGKNVRRLPWRLWKKAAVISRLLFDSMNLGLQAKLEIMRRYPHMGTFVMKAYYEKDPDVRPAIQESIAKYADFKTNTVLLNLNPEHFIEGLDLEMMYLDMLWASEGYIWEKLQHDHINVDEIEADFIKLIDFWKSIYLRKER